MKDYGSDYPVTRRRLKHRWLKVIFGASTLSIILFFVVFGITITKLFPRAVIIELDRRIATVEQHIAGGNR